MCDKNTSSCFALAWYCLEKVNVSVVEIRGNDCMFRGQLIQFQTAKYEANGQLRSETANNSYYRSSFKRPSSLLFLIRMKYRLE